MKRFGTVFLAYLSAFLVSLVGLAWQMVAPSPAVMAVLGVLAFVPVVLFAINRLLSKRFKNRIDRAKVADMQGYMLRHREEAETASVMLLKRLRARRRFAIAYTVLIGLLAVAAALLGGMLYHLAVGLLHLFLLYGGLLFYAVLTGIPKKDPIKLPPDALVLSPEDYPRLHGTARRAADTMGCRGEIVLLLTLDSSASILRDGNRYFLQLGIVLLHLLSEEELYAICLHEFSHTSDKNKPIERELQYGNQLEALRDSIPALRFAVRLFEYSDLRYMFDRMIYLYASSVVRETEADRDMATHGDPAAAASALLKTDYDIKYDWESFSRVETPVYAAEAPNPHYLRDRIRRYRQAIEDRHADWDAMIAAEILPNNASHPILRMRWETLGVEGAEYRAPVHEPAYGEELERALDYADRWLLDQQDTYDKDRKEAYLEPLERVTAWEQEGKPLLAETYADLVGDLRQLCRHEEAEALCHRAIDELDAGSSAHAYMVCGCALLSRYDRAGIEMIYKAIEINYNYLEQGLEAVGRFCCMTGRAEELADYRARAPKLAQKDKDEFSQASFLSKGDNLSADRMPEGMLEDILSYIHSVDTGIIQRIFLVRKTVSNSFFASVFVIHFYGGTEAAEQDIMHKIFRYLDTYPGEWHFSLFDYFDCRHIRFDKIEGSLIYDKSQSTT